MGGVVPESCVSLIEELDSEMPAEKQQQLSPPTRKQLCPYAAVGECRYGVNCAYLHGDVCDLCGLQVLHPTDLSQRSQHTKVAKILNMTGISHDALQNWGIFSFSLGFYIITTVTHVITTITLRAFFIIIIDLSVSSLFF